MRIVFKKNSIMKALLLLLLIADTSFFSITSISSFFEPISTEMNKILVCFLVLLLVLCSILMKKGRLDISRCFNTSIEKFLLCYLGIVAVTFLVSKLVYGGSIGDYAGRYYYYVVLLLFFVLNNCISEDKTFTDFLINSVIVVGLIMAVVSLAMSIAYSQTGKYLLNDNTLSYYVYSNGRLRAAGMADIVSLAAVFSLNQFLARRGKGNFHYMISFATCFLALLVVGQTRAYEVAVFVPLVITWFSIRKDANYKIFAFIVAALGLLLVSDSIISFFNSFVTNAYSTETRLEAYGYYLSHIFDNVLVGIGFVPSDSGYYYLIHGNKGIYYLSDCGYIGVIGMFGVLGLILIVLFIRALHETIRKARRSSMFIPAINLAAFMLISNWSLSFNDIYRITYLPLLLVVLAEYSGGGYSRN